MSQNFVELLDKKMKLETELKTLEQQILELETSYLEETQNTGNIIKGWEGYFANKNIKQQNITNQKKTKISPNDRVFSLSSTTSPAYQNVEENADRNINNSLGLPTYVPRTKRNKKKQKYDKLARDGYQDSPRSNEPDSSQLTGQDDYVGTSDLEENNFMDGTKESAPLKKKKIKKHKKLKQTKGTKINNKSYIQNNGSFQH